jgi:hypothetical protein
MAVAPLGPSRHNRSVLSLRRQRDALSSRLNEAERLLLEAQVRLTDRELAAEINGYFRPKAE